MKSSADVLDRPWRERRVREAMARLTAGLDRGETIAQALGPSLDALETGIVSAAERAGRLDAGFRHLEHYYGLLAKSGAAIRTALAYPVVMLHFGIVIPVMLGAILGRQSAIPAIAIALVKLYAVLAVVWLGWRGLQKLAERHEGTDRLLRRIPLIGPARLSLAITRWSAVMHFLVVAGGRISDALRSAGAASRSATIDAASRRAANAVESGSTLGDALESGRVFPYDLVSAVATAECAGKLDEETARLAVESNSEATLRLGRVAEWLPRLCYFAVMGFLVWQIFKVASQYLGMQAGFMKEIGF